MSERAAGNEAPIAAALGAMLAYDGVARIEPAEEPMIILPSSVG